MRRPRSFTTTSAAAVAAVLVAGVAVFLFGSTARAAQDVTTGAAARPAGAAAGAVVETGWSGSNASLAQTVGLGTFVSDANARTPYLATVLEIAPQYAFRLGEVRLLAALREFAAFEQTKPDNPTGRRLSYSDLGATLAAPALWTERWSGIALTPSLRLSAPLSPESRWAGLRGTVGPGVGLSRRLGAFGLSYGLRFTKGWYANTARIATPEEAMVSDEQGRALFLCRPGAGACASAGMNTDFSVRNAVQVTYRASEKLSFTLGYALQNDFHYPTPQDAFTAKAVDANGERIVSGGRGRADLVFGTLRADYQLSAQWSLSADLSTAGPARTADNRALRFPFFDFESPANNLTTFSIGVTASM